MRVALAALFIGLPAAALAEDDVKTARTWKAKCASCHGADGKGQTEQAKKMGGIRDMSTAEWQKDWTDEKVKKAIVDGVKEGKKEMEAYKDKLKPDQVDALVKFVRTFKK